jgi:hypothetical protein|nr:MAG TPA: Protein of unknown function (DUF1642) [Caudoviricetes sp.]
MSEILSNNELRNQIVSLSGYRSDFPKDYELGFIDCRSEVLEIIEKYVYDNTVYVPEYVAVWFEENKHALELAIFTKIRELDDTRYPHDTDFENWLDNAENKPIETLIRMKDGYEVEKEPVWAIKNAHGNYLTKCDLWGKDGVNYSFECNPSDKLLFTDKVIADAAALLVNGTAEQEQA